MDRLLIICILVVQLHRQKRKVTIEWDGLKSDLFHDTTNAMVINRWSARKLRRFTEGISNIIRICILLILQNHRVHGLPNKQNKMSHGKNAKYFNKLKLFWNNKTELKDHATLVEWTFKYMRYDRYSTGSRVVFTRNDVWIRNFIDVAHRRVPRQQGVLKAGGLRKHRFKNRTRPSCKQYYCITLYMNVSVCNTTVVARRLVLLLPYVWLWCGEYIMNMAEKQK